MKVLVRWTGPLRDALAQAFRKRMLREAEGLGVGRFQVFAADGTHRALARTASNAAYAPRRTRGRANERRSQTRERSAAARRRASVEKKSESPHMRLTLLHPSSLRLPWDWRRGSYSAGERGRVLEMLESLPPDALVAADCGPAGYDFMTAPAASGRSFVIRVGGNVGLLRKLYRVREAERLVHLWPWTSAEKRRPPLSLRRVVVHDGRRTLNLLASKSSASPRRDRPRSTAAS